MSAALVRPRSRQDQHRPSGLAGAARPSRQLLIAAAAAAGVLLVVLAAVWSVSSAGRSLTAPPGSVLVDSGVARVDQVLSAARPQHAMPGMGSDDDPVAEDERRVSVEVTLQATGDEPLRFSVDDFTLRVPGGEDRPPHRSLLPETEMPAGTTLSGVLVFDVPRDATVGLLSYGGGGRARSCACPRRRVSGRHRPRPGPPPASPDQSHPTDHATPLTCGLTDVRPQPFHGPITCCGQSWVETGQGQEHQT